MSKQILSAFPYYGGKARMCPLICSKLDYRSTELYIEPYGGGARVLLNKPRHPAEMYNDLSAGVSGFFRVMTDADMTEKLIDMLWSNPPSREQFQEMLIDRLSYEDRLNDDVNAVVKNMSWDIYKRCGLLQFKELKNAAGNSDFEKMIQCLELILDDKAVSRYLESLEKVYFSNCLELYKDYWAMVSKNCEKVRQEAEFDFDEAWTKHLNMSLPEKGTPLEKIYIKAKNKCVQDSIREEIESYTNDIQTSNAKGSVMPDTEVAFMIFQLYFASRDGMGTTWSDVNGNNIKAYNKAVANLRKISDRMRDVTVMNIGAGYLVELYRKDERVMLYLDPSYLKPEDQKINLGKVYKKSYGYEEHEQLLQTITKSDTRAKIMISNYDVDLYNDYLIGWKKTYYETYTSVGGTKGNKRVEVLWQNY